MSDKDSKGSYGGIVQLLMSGIQQNPIFVKEIEKKGGGNSFVSIGKGVIFDNKIEKMSGFFLHRRIHFLTPHRFGRSLRYCRETNHLFRCQIDCFAHKRTYRRSLVCTPHK